MELRENAPLAPLTTFKIGGQARFLLRIYDAREIPKALTFARSQKLPVMILGGGSNMLIDDAGFEGVVLKIEIRGAELTDALLVAGAGEEWDPLVAQVVEAGYWGIENLAGIPGTIGGAAVQNIGAYGTALSEVVEWVEVFDMRTDMVKRFTNVDCAFGYRTSAMKRGLDRFIVLRVALRLTKEAAPNLSYKDLTETFAANPTPSLQEIRRAVLAIRAKKFPNLSQEGTAGSFFMNPVVSTEDAATLQAKYPTMPVFPLPEAGGRVKIPLAWLLDNVLHARGMRHGNARLFEAQPLVIAVTWPASSSDVVALAKEVQEKIFSTCGITIEPEVCIIHR